MFNFNDLGKAVLILLIIAVVVGIMIGWSTACVIKW